MNIGEWVRSNQPTNEQIAIAQELNKRGVETFTDAVFAMGQDALTFIASSIADPIAGLAGIGLSSFNGVIQGTDTINNVRRASSYVPKTRQNPLNYLLPDSFKQNVGQFAKDITGQDVGKFGLEMAPITGEIMSGKAAIDSIKNPPSADDFIVNGQFNDRAYNKAMQSHGGEIGLNAMGAIPLAGAAVRGAQRLPDLARVIGNEALRPNMVNQTGAINVGNDSLMGNNAGMTEIKKKYFSSGDLTDENVSRIQEFLKLIDEDDGMGYGLRIIPEDYPVKKGERLQPSYLWGVDGDGSIRTTEPAEGVSTIDITSGYDEADIDYAIKKLRENKYSGGQVALVRGEAVDLNLYSDDGELNLKDGEVLEVLSGSDLGLM